MEVKKDNQLKKGMKNTQKRERMKYIEEGLEIRKDINPM
jgi:hypothetical protein